ncbi:hypothetical protein [Kaistella sp.]
MSEQIHTKIGDIAMNAKGPMTINQLADKLGITNTGRNITNYIRGAVGHFNRSGKSHISGRIEGTYTDENGKYYYNTK